MDYLESHILGHAVYKSRWSFICKGIIIIPSLLMIYEDKIISRKEKKMQD